MKIFAESPKIIQAHKMANRKYREFRSLKYESLALSGINFSLGAYNAALGNSFLALLLGGGALLMLKAFQESRQNIKMIEPKFLEIKERLERINKAKALNEIA